MPKVLTWLNKHVCERGQRCSCFIDRCCGYDWSEACAMHDRRYANARLSRKQADELLRRSVKRKTNSGILSSLMYIGVRSFGWIWYKG